MQLISIVMPVYNEELNVRRAHAEVSQVLSTIEGIRAEFIFADNHSTDRTFDELRKLAEEDPRVRVLRYARNFGFNKSLLTAYRHAKGDAAIQIDCDLEDPPEIIREFIRLWREGHDVVVGIRAKRQENWLLAMGRRAFYWLMNAISEETHVIDAGDFRLVDRSVLSQLCRVRDAKPYVRGLVSELTRRQGSVRYARNRRMAGESKFRMGALIKLAFEGIFSQSTVPLQLASVMGILIAVGMALVSAIYIALRLFSNNWPAGFASTTVLILFGISVNAIFLGIIGEYIGRIYAQVRDRPVVIVEDAINIETNDRLTFPQATHS